MSDLKKQIAWGMRGDSDLTYDMCVPLAQAAIDAIAAAGYVIVPREATMMMKTAGMKCAPLLAEDEVSGIWQAMNNGSLKD